MICALHRRLHPDEAYYRLGIEGYSICGRVVLAGQGTTDSAQVTCTECRALMEEQVEKALGGDVVHYTMARWGDVRRHVAVCGFKAHPGRLGRVSCDGSEVTCPACRAIGEADA